MNTFAAGLNFGLANSMFQNMFGNTFLFNPFMSNMFLFNPFMNFNLYPTFSMPNFNLGSFSLYNNLSAPLFSMPEFKPEFSNINFSQPNIFSFGVAPSTPSSGNFDTFEHSKPTGKLTTNTLSQYSSLKVYNPEKGKRLAEYAYNHIDSNWKEHDCKTHVRLASENAGLGTIEGGNGVKSLSSLRNNPNYKEISANEIDWQHPPIGTIGIFEPKSQGYSETDGHTEIYAEINGNSVGLSNYITHNIKKADYYFIPV